MNQCRKTFEALMRGKGHQDFTVTASGMYKVPSLQVRWNYFQLGWNLAEAQT